MEKSHLELFKESLREFVKNTPREEILKMLGIEEEEKEATYSDFLVPKELALNLKDVGFDVPCMINFYESDPYFFRFEGRNIEMGDLKPSFNKNGYCVVPSYDQVMKWFRDKGYEINIIYSYSKDLGMKIGYIYDVIYENEVLIGDQYFNTYEDARDSAIDEVLEHLRKQK